MKSRNFVWLKPWLCLLQASSWSGTETSRTITSATRTASSLMPETRPEVSGSIIQQIQRSFFCMQLGEFLCFCRIQLFSAVVVASASEWGEITQNWVHCEGHSGILMNLIKYFFHCDDYKMGVRKTGGQILLGGKNTFSVYAPTLSLKQFDK